MAILTYSNRQDIKGRYGARGIENFIMFESRLYNYVETTRAARRIIHVYRCEKEQHTIKIYVRAGIVIDVRAFYQI